MSTRLRRRQTAPAQGKDNYAEDDAVGDPKTGVGSLLRKWWWVAIPVAVAAIVVVSRSLPPTIEVVRPRSAPVVQTITLSGRVAGLQESAVAPEAAGVLAELLVDDGDRVERGSLLGRVSTDVASAQLVQAIAAVATAQAQLKQAQADAGIVPSQLKQAEAEAGGAVREAEERLRRAELLLDELRAGGTDEQRRQARAAVEQARSRVGQARRDLQRADRLADVDATARSALDRALADIDEARARHQKAVALKEDADADVARARRLFSQDAIAKVDFDKSVTTQRAALEEAKGAEAALRRAEVEAARQEELLASTRQTEVERARTEFDVAEHALESAQARLDELTTPARAEALARQEAEVRAATAALRAVRTGGAARVETVRKTPSAERISLARSRLAEAVASRDAALARLATSDLTAPFTGVITEILSRPGTLVGPGQPVLRITEMLIPEVHVDVDERDLAKIAVGQPAMLVTDVYPERSADAEVVQIAPRADPQRGVVRVTLHPLEEVDWLRSGMTTDATIILAPQSTELVLPTSAVIRADEGVYVYVVDGGVVRQIEIVVGHSRKEGTVVLSGISDSSDVVAEPLKTKVGQRVRPRAVGERREF